MKESLYVPSSGSLEFNCKIIMSINDEDFSFDMRRSRRVMDGSTLALVGDVDYIAFGAGPTDFSMQVLNHRDSQVEVRPKSVNAVSNGLQRSFSYAMEGTMVSREVDLYEVCREGDVDALNTLLETSQPNLDHSNAKGLSPLHYAARNNHAEVIQLLINHGADPNVRSRVEHKALSPLHFAAWFNAAKAVDVLLRNGANVESGSAFGQKPLHYAVSRASAELVMTLITKGKANLNGLDNHRFSPLHLATQRGRLDIIKILIEHGADISAVNEESETAIHIAAREGRDEVLRHLLQRVSMTGLSCKDLVNKENDEAKTCLHLAVQGGHVEAAMVCLEYGANLRSVKKCRDHLPLHVASSLGDLQMVKFLVSHDLIKVDEEDSGGMTPILRASLSGNVEVIEHLLNKGASINPLSGCTAPSPLMCAVMNGHHDAIKFLLQRGALIDFTDSYHRTCLHVAAHGGNADTVNIILKNGGRDLIYSVDKENRTPLHHAACNGSLQIVQTLLKAEADVNIKDYEEKVPLHLAAESGNLACVKLLLEANPKSLHNTEYRMRTPIHYAALEGHVHVVKFLLDQGANPDYRDENHLTPLMMAAQKDHYQTVVLLLDYGAKIGARSKNRTTAIDVAAYFGNARIVRVLLNRGASVTNKCVFGQGCLDCAIKGSRPSETSLEILKHKRWKEAIEVKDDDGFCMMNKLIEKLPEVAKVAMDKCLETSDGMKTDEAFSISYNFVYLDPVPGKQTNSKGMRYFGPKVMLKCGHRELILHPLTRELMKLKRQALIIKFFLLAAVFYISYTINLTIFVLCLESLKIDEVRNSTTFFSQNVCVENLEPIRGVTAVISISALLSHIYRIYVEKWSYWMDVSNTLELMTFFSALVSVSRFINRSEEFELSFAIIATLLAYLTLMSHLQSLLKTGIYITMMFEVLRTLLTVLAMFFLLLLAFALAFHVLLSREANASRAGFKIEENDRGYIKYALITGFLNFISDDDPFGSVELALLKVLDMMIGELEYNTFFVDKNLYLPELTRFIFAFFCVLIPIVFMNLLIGLAVGDIESVQRNAELKLLAIEIEDVFTFERRLPNCFLRRIHKPSITKYPNKKVCGWRKGITQIRRMISGMKDNSSLDDDDEGCLEQTAAAMSNRIYALEQTVDRLNVSIDTQTEMLENLVRMLAAKEKEAPQPSADIKL